MVRYLVDRPYGLSRRYVKAAGSSQDEKPTEGIVTGSRFLEADTGQPYIFDEESGEWLPDRSGGDMSST